MNIFKPLFLLFFLSISLFACSDNQAEKSSKKHAPSDHVWKQQTDALKSAKDVTKTLQQSLNQNKQKLDESN